MWHCARAFRVTVAISPPPHVNSLSLHDALPIYGFTDDPIDDATQQAFYTNMDALVKMTLAAGKVPVIPHIPWPNETDRKSTRLNSSHPSSSYAVFCLHKIMR